MASMAVQLSLFAALLFIIISSAPVYKATNSISERVIKLKLADSVGNATRAGLIVHSLVFFAVLYGFARMNKV